MEAALLKASSFNGHHPKTTPDTETWLTPPWILRALGAFDLDPATPLNRPWDTAVRHLTKVEDGLASPWGEGEFVFLNPPYGDGMYRWLAKLADHPAGGIALIFARTDTEGFHAHVWGKASALLFIKGRLTFYTAEGVPGDANAGAPSALIGYGPEAQKRLYRAASMGRIPGAYTDVFYAHREPSLLDLLHETTTKESEAA